MSWSPARMYTPPPQHSPQPDDFLAQARSRLEDYLVQVQRLHQLHKQYEALQHEQMSNEERRQAFLAILQAELDVLEEARATRDALQALLNAYLPRPRSGE